MLPQNRECLVPNTRRGDDHFRFDESIKLMLALPKCSLETNDLLSDSIDLSHQLNHAIPSFRHNSW